jgi:hypothetical protein
VESRVNSLARVYIWKGIDSEASNSEAKAKNFKPSINGLTSPNFVLEKLPEGSFSVNNPPGRVK